MRLSRPSIPVFLISVIIAIAVAAVRYAGIDVPVVSGATFEALAIAYIVLLAGVLLKGL